MLFLGSVWFHSEASFDPGQKPIDAKKHDADHQSMSLVNLTFWDVGSVLKIGVCHVCEPLHRASLPLLPLEF